MLIRRLWRCILLIEEIDVFDPLNSFFGPPTSFVEAPSPFRPLLLQTAVKTP